MQLTPRIHLVGSGSGGFDLTDPFDCNIYLIDGGGESALVDVGIGSSVDRVLANARDAGIDLDSLRRVVLTHGHPDHSGGAAYLRDRLPQIDIAASTEVAKWVGEGDESALSVDAGKAADFYPRDYRFRACHVDRELSEGDRLRVGSIELEVIETPGHADGHLCFVLRGDDETVLFSGDLVFYGGLISLENNWDCRLAEYASSMAKLRGLNVDVLSPGHHSFSLKAGQRHIDAANKLFDNGFVPKSIV